MRMGISGLAVGSAQRHVWQQPCRPVLLHPMPQSCAGLVLISKTTWAIFGDNKNSGRSKEKKARNLPRTGNTCHLTVDRREKAQLVEEVSDEE